MLIGIISDSHDNLANIEKSLTWLKEQGVELLIHCGDVCAPATLREIAENFSGPIHLVFGNVDGDHFRMTKLAMSDLSNVKIHGEKGEIEADGKKIVFTHFPDFGRGLATSGNYDIVFVGHTHQPWIEKINHCLLVNPGTLAGMFSKATFAIYDTAKPEPELKILETL